MDDQNLVLPTPLAPDTIITPTAPSAPVTPVAAPAPGPLPASQPQSAPMAPAAPVPLPTPPAPQAAPIASQPPAPATVAPVQAPAIADDGDLIEKEWVNRAQHIVATTAGDPHAQNQQLSQLKADYLQKRYGKVIKLED